jgi:hypothetical protein
MEAAEKARWNWPEREFFWKTGKNLKKLVMKIGYNSI